MKTLTLEALLAELPNAVAVQRGGEILAWSDHGLRLLASTEDETDLWSCFRPEDRPALERTEASALAGETAHEALEVRTSHPEYERVVELHQIAVPAASGPATLVVGRDMTPQLQAAATAAGMDRMVVVGALAAGVAHEINNPLTYVVFNLESLAEDIAVMGMAAGALHDALLAAIGETAAREAVGQALEHFSPDFQDDVRERLAEVAEGAERVRRVVSDLNTFARGEATATRDVDLHDAIETAVTLTRQDRFDRATCVLELSPDARFVPAHRARLAHAIVSVLRYCAHAFDGPAPENRIAVRARRDGVRIVVEVSNNAPPPPTQELERLFEPYVTTGALDRGTGLGLAVARNIVESYGGRLDVELTSSDETLFRMILPTGVERAESLSHSFSGQRGRVLVVDDARAIGRAVRRMLEGFHEVVVAESGLQAQHQMAEDDGYDLILLDVVMADRSGIELLDWARTERPQYAERIVFISGGGYGPEVQQFLDETDRPVLYKPFRAEHVCRLVDEALTKLAA